MKRQKSKQPSLLKLGFVASVLVVGLFFQPILVDAATVTDETTVRLNDTTKISDNAGVVSGNNQTQEISEIYKVSANNGTSVSSNVSANTTGNVQNKGDKQDNVIKKTGIVKESDGLYYYYKDGVIDKSCNGFIQDHDIWYKISEGQVDITFTGIGTDETDHYCYFINGVQSTDFTGMAQNEIGWWYYVNGSIVWNYTGLGTNEFGTWYYQNGRIEFDYSDFAVIDGRWYKFAGGRVDTAYNAMGTAQMNNFCYFQNGVESLDYTGMAVNEVSWWYYVDGKIAWNYTGIGTNEYGTWIYQNGWINFGFNDFIEIDNLWYKFIDGHVDTSFRGMGTADMDNFCYFHNGVEDLNYTGMGVNEVAWWYYVDGKIDWTHTGLETNEYGTWIYQNGTINFGYFGYLSSNGIWYVMNGGHIDTEYTAMGIAETDNFCMFVNGIESFDYTGMACNDAGWWYYNNGKLDWTYYGFGHNEKGYFLYQNGQIDFNAYGLFPVNGDWWKIKHGWVETTYTGMAANDAGWWFVGNGKVVFEYTGLGINNAGFWWYINGTIDFTFCGNVTIDGVDYYVNNGYIGPLNDYKIVIPYDVSYHTISCWGDSMTQGVGATAGHDYPSQLRNLTHYTTHNFGIGGELSTQIEDRALDYYDGDSRDILLLEMGSNGGWNSYDDLIDQYKEIIDASGSHYFIIIGDTDDPGTSIADTDQTEYNDDGDYVGFRETAWEAALHEAFGDHFFNTRLYLLKNGFSDTGLIETDSDRELISEGKIPDKLRYDWTHFNNHGYYSKAIGIYKKGIELGYWE